MTKHIDRHSNMWKGMRGRKERWFVLATLLVLISVAACQNNPEKKRQTTAKVIKKSTVYTCPMHHQIRSDKPGKCPVCGMTLVPVENEKPETGNMPDMDHMSDTGKMSGMKSMKSSAQQIKLSPKAQGMAGVHTDTARLLPLDNQIVLTGTAIFDPQNQKVISAWVSGWIEKLYIQNPGEYISTGQRLYDLYSPELLSAEKDYLLAIQQKKLFRKASVDFTATIRAMKQKLLRWGLTDIQIANLQKSQPTGKVTIFSKAAGYLSQKIEEEGNHINEGDVVMSIAQNNTLWVQAQLYDSELPILAAPHPKIWVTSDALSGKKIPRKIVFDNPVNGTNSRLHLVHIAIPNPGGKLQPGMLVYVYLQSVNKTATTMIPKSAVIYDVEHDYVWVQKSTNQFERRNVQLGNDNNSMIQILRGVQSGEKVVSQGAYLVNSEYVLRHGSGVNMAGMQMSDMKMKGKAE